jgi:hypothetical protein
VRTSAAALQGCTHDWPAAQQWVRADGRPDVDALEALAGASCVCATDQTRWAARRGRVLRSLGARRAAGGSAASAPLACRQADYGADVVQEVRLAEYAAWWRQHSGGAPGPLLYLKDWHYAAEWPQHKVMACA